MDDLDGHRLGRDGPRPKRLRVAVASLAVPDIFRAADEEPAAFDLHAAVSVATHRHEQARHRRRTMWMI